METILVDSQIPLQENGNEPPQKAEKIDDNELEHLYRAVQKKIELEECRPNLKEEIGDWNLEIH